MSEAKEYTPTAGTATSLPYEREGGDSEPSLDRF